MKSLLKTLKLREATTKKKRLSLSEVQKRIEGMELFEDKMNIARKSLSTLKSLPF